MVVVSAGANETENQSPIKVAALVVDDGLLVGVVNTNDVTDTSEVAALCPPWPGPGP